MKKNKEEMKNDIAAVKNSIESIKSRLEEAEDRISERKTRCDQGNSHCSHPLAALAQSLCAVSGCEQGRHCQCMERRRRGCWQRGDRGPWQEKPGRDAEDGLRPAPVPNTASRPAVPFEVHKFVHWAPTEAREAPATTAELTSCEPGFWLSGAPPVGAHSPPGDSSWVENLPPHDPQIAQAHAPSLAAPQPHLAPHVGLAPPPHLLHHPTMVPLSSGPIGAGSTSTAAHCQHHVANIHHVSCHPLVRRRKLSVCAMAVPQHRRSLWGSELGVWRPWLMRWHGQVGGAAPGGGVWWRLGRRSTRQCPKRTRVSAQPGPAEGGLMRELEGRGGVWGVAGNMRLSVPAAISHGTYLPPGLVPVPHPPVAELAYGTSVTRSH
ncbi:hypothetical protein QTO34_008351 [Cnephaeus nilssonii]|uniref:Uncharacterized protein n=1 Tax=Cnephaeus nilssonii TaxID=3371016 RepID=A0AA40LTS2_CNENI|nr:hypothetical protein QTO34_008351 [Eptesicus nilssonii]